MNCQILRRLSLRTASINLCSSVIQYAQRIRRLRQAKKISIKRSEQPASAGDFAMEHLRIAALHDISGFGRGSMTTAVSVCAAAGIQCCPLVGAVLSAHTAYPNVTIRDLTEDLPSCVANWQAIGCQFDGFYSGYMSDIIDTNKSRTIQPSDSTVEKSLIERMLADVPIKNPRNPKIAETAITILTASRLSL